MDWEQIAKDRGEAMSALRAQLAEVQQQREEFRAILATKLGELLCATDKLAQRDADVHPLDSTNNTLALHAEINRLAQQVDRLRAQLAQRDADAQRWQEARKRLQVVPQYSIAGDTEARPTLKVKIGCSFLDREVHCPPLLTPPEWEQHLQTIDAAVDAALATSNEPASDSTGPTPAAKS